MTRLRYRRRPVRTVDPHRVVQAIRGPGVDTRTWIATARIDDDDDASRWDAEHGWLVDVTFVGGPLDGEGPVTCKVASPVGGAEQGDAHPPPRGCEAVVVLPEGDPNVMPVIVGYVNNADGCRAPGQVQGEELDEDLARATHVRVTNGSLRWQVGELLALSASDLARLLGQNVELAEEGASQAYVRGNDLADKWGPVLEELIAWLPAVDTGISGGGGSPPSNTSLLKTKVEQLKAALVEGGILSERIKGE